MPNYKKKIEAAQQKLNYSEKQKAEYKRAKEYKQIISDISGDVNLSANIASIATRFLNGNIDISDQAQLDLFMFKNPITGEYTPIGLLAPKDTSKESFVKIANQLLYAVESGSKIYNFSNVLNTNQMNVLSKDSDGHLNIDGERFEPASVEMPKAVKKPSGFKMFTNRVFGWFKKDCSEYNKYLDDKKVFDATVEKNNEELKKKFNALEGKHEALDKCTSMENTYNEVEAEVKNSLTTEDKLEIAAQEEREQNCAIDVVAGKSNKALGRNQNYKALVEVKLANEKNLPMEGLALLVANNIDINKDIRDGSTPVGQSYEIKEGMTAADIEKLHELEHVMTVTNVSSKIMQSFFSGKDIQRMGPRAEAVTKSRIALNEAVEALKAGNKEPLADLINGSMEPVLRAVRTGYSRLDGPMGQAISKIASAYTQLLEEYPEMRFSLKANENELNVLKGIGKACDIMCNSEQKKYENYLKDEGPGTPERKEVVEDMMFRGFVKAVLVKEGKNNEILANEAKNKQKANSPYMALMEYYPKEKLSKSPIGGIDTKLTVDNFKYSEIITNVFADDNFSKESFMKESMDILRNTPEYEKLMNMSKDDLAKADVQKDTKEIVDRTVEAKIKELFAKSHQKEKTMEIENAGPQQMM